ncbi:MAG: hypothetical protein LBH46_04325 [Rickettsiales bacterium]|jgi:hypothetical protein|nr:hypothetical protein [Rickettsiales bacterium]
MENLTDKYYKYEEFFLNKIIYQFFRYSFGKDIIMSRKYKYKEIMQYQKFMTDKDNFLLKSYLELHDIDIDYYCDKLKAKYELFNSEFFKKKETKQAQQTEQLQMNSNPIDLLSYNNIYPNEL